jgi:hypothetical protein
MAVTRGRGLLEPFLARQRSKIANRLIGAQHRTGRILDIGCGSHPYFLSHTSFKEKFAIDQLAREHLDPSKLVDLFVECRRVLRHTGHVILTTPASWTDNLLDFMARLKLVSKEEIDEHVFTYTLPLIGWYFGAAGFDV